MAERMILITNDDGVNARGLLALKQALDSVARVEVFAPDRNWSAASRTRTFHKPLRVDEVRLLDGSLGHDFEVILVFQQLPGALSHNGVVVGEQDFDGVHHDIPIRHCHCP